MGLFTTMRRLPGGGPVGGEISAARRPGRVAVLGRDYPGLRLRALVGEGQSVAAGAPLLQDRHDSAISIVSPVAGRVEEIRFGRGRRLSHLSIQPGDTTETVAATRPETEDTPGLAAFLKASGLWTAFLERPFGRIPAGSGGPDAILVIAAAPHPGAPQADALLTDRRQAFERGLAALERLTSGPLLMTHDRRERISPGGRIRPIAVEAATSGALPGTIIDRFVPVTGGRRVWQIGAQDVARIGDALETGLVPFERVVAIAGAGTAASRLLRMVEGAEILPSIGDARPKAGGRVLAGPAIGGAASRFLPARCNQITILPGPRRADEPDRPRWHVPTRRPLRAAPLIPHAALDGLLGPDVPALPLLRALSVGDAEEARRLGALALLEEDIAPLTWASGGTEDFGALLRSTLDTLAREDRP